MSATTPLTGRALLKDPVRNKGTAFTRQQRHDLGLEGLLPHAVESVDRQLERVRIEYDTKRTDLGRRVFLRQLQDSSRVLFYRFVIEHLEELLPMVSASSVWGIKASGGDGHPDRQVGRAAVTDGVAMLRLRAAPAAQTSKLLSASSMPRWKVG